MKQKNYNIPTVVYFVVTALLIAYFFPREGKFRYQFYEGKPWRYGLLTAPSDFPIYKTDDEVKAEKDSVLRKFEPYYRINPGIQKEEIEKLRANYNNDNSLRSKVSPAYMQYIESSLINLYKNGIISSQDLDELRKEEYSRVNLLENAVAQPHYVSDFFTVRTAYEFIINNCPSRLDKSILQSCDINNYLTENISYAADMSDKIKEDMLQGVSIANGMVQAGERIVDRGEIIDNHTYNVLRSLKAIHEAKTGHADARHHIGRTIRARLRANVLFLALPMVFPLEDIPQPEERTILDPLHIRELHPYGTMCYLRIIQRIYIAVRHRTDRSTYLLRFPDGAFHAPYHRADLLVDGTFPA